MEASLRAAHPWWFGQGMADDDLHLRRLARSQFKWEPPALTEIHLRFEDTHTLRGPRQAGKTTTLKRLMKRLIDSGETRILYFAFDVALPPNTIGDIVRAAKRIHPSPRGPWFVFFDEITAIPDWQIGIKSAWDTGLTADDALLLTASSAHDLKRGAERLPGRRGKGKDYLQLPLSFRDYCIAAHDVSFDDEPLAPEEFLSPRGEQVASRLASQGPALREAFASYLRVGGFPAAVNDSMISPQEEVSIESIQMLWDVIAGDISRSHRDRTAALKLLQAIGASLGSPLSWPNAARGMAVDSPHTAKDYAEFLAEIFAVLTVYFWDIGRASLEPSRQRKLYWLDPLMGAMPRTLIPGTPAPAEDGMVECVVAAGLFRAAAQTLIQSTAVPGAIGYWKSSNDRELDFMIPRATHLELPRLPVEVKGDNSAGLSRARAAIRARFQNGLVLSRNVFEWGPDIATLPVWAFLAGLREQPARRITFA